MSPCKITNAKLLCHYKVCAVVYASTHSITYGIYCEYQALGTLKALQHQTNFDDVIACRTVAYLDQTKKSSSHNKNVMMSAFVI